MAATAGSKGDFDAAVGAGDLVVVSFTSAKSAGGEIADQLAGESIKVLKVDTDASKDIVKAARIKTAPTFVVYKGGAEVGRVEQPDADQVKNVIAQNQ